MNPFPAGRRSFSPPKLWWSSVKRPVITVDHRTPAVFLVSNVVAGVQLPDESPPAFAVSFKKFPRQFRLIRYKLELGYRDTRRGETKTNKRQFNRENCEYAEITQGTKRNLSQHSNKYSLDRVNNIRNYTLLRGQPCMCMRAHRRRLEWGGWFSIVRGNRMEGGIIVEHRIASPDRS